MATVTHGLKDGIDEILEKANALERILEVRLDGMPTIESNDSKRETMSSALNEVRLLKDTATSTRAAIDRVRASLRDR